MDACEYCRTEFGPASAERECRNCGAPRAAWEHFAEDDLETRGGGKGCVLQGSGDVTIWPNGETTTLTVIPYEASAIDVFELTCAGWHFVRLVSARIGRADFVGSEVPLTRFAIRTLANQLEDEIVYPFAGVQIGLRNISSSPVNASVDLALRPLPQCPAASPTWRSS